MKIKKVENDGKTQRKIRWKMFFLFLVGLGVVLCRKLMASESMPWDGPLKKLLDNLAGPTARTVSIISVILLMLGLMFGHGGGIVQKLLQICIAIAVCFVAATWVPSFFGHAGGMLI
ncbi:MAG: TrbC/VirB2 family protein [Fusobacteriaceae bacterium]|jgi:type IV secretory pathway VirB2 component (pilin)|nr:TrbC/VirB2 family protein [Fusobacteriaceae bacterium]